MHTLHVTCTDSCAAETQCSRGFRRFAHITHIFSRNNNIEHPVYVYRYLSSKKYLTKVSCEICVQCVQIAKSLATKGLQLHSYMCASLCNVCIFGVNHHE